MKKRTECLIALLLFSVVFVIVGCSKQEQGPTAEELASAEVKKGIEATSQGKLEEGMACFQKALEYNPEHPRAWCGMGTVYREMDQYDKAVEHYRKVGSISSHKNSKLWDLLNFSLGFISLIREQ